MSPECIRLPTLWAMLAICLLATGTYAQEQPEQQSDPPQESTEPAGPDDALGRGTQRQSVRGFVAATANGDFEAAAEYLDLRNLPHGLAAGDGPRLSRNLDIVLERELFWIDIDSLSDEPD